MHNVPGQLARKGKTRLRRGNINSSRQAFRLLEYMMRGKMARRWAEASLQVAPGARNCRATERIKFSAAPIQERFQPSVPRVQELSILILRGRILIPCVKVKSIIKH